MSKKILIVDDEPHIRFLLEQVLEDIEEEGVELLMASDGQAALDTIMESHPELVFLDVMMPKVNGYDVCHRVKNDLELEDVHIVMLTAKGQGFDREKGDSAGADAFMTKPFDPDTIVNKAREVLEMN